VNPSSAVIIGIPHPLGSLLPGAPRTWYFMYSGISEHTHSYTHSQVTSSVFTRLQTGLDDAGKVFTSGGADN
jgi:hypothetical protein